MEETLLELLAALPVPVQPQDIPAEQARLEDRIRQAILTCANFNRLVAAHCS